MSNPAIGPNHAPAGDCANGQENRRISVQALMAPAFYGVHHALRAGAYSDIWLKGGRGSGKSSFASLEVVMGLLRSPLANAIVYRKVAATLRDSVYAQMVWAVEKLGVSAYWQCRLSPMELVYTPTGQRIIFRGADDPQKSKGLKLHKGYFKYLWLEELTEFDGMEDVRTIKASVIRGGEAVTLCTYNPPKSAASWVNAEAVRPVPGRLAHHSTYLDIPRQWLGDSFYAEAEALKAANSLAYRHMYLGEATGTGGQVFGNVRLRALQGDALASVLGLHAYCGHDFGFAVDPDAFVRCAYDPRRKTLYIVDEYVRTGLSLDALAWELKRRSWPEVVTADSAEPRSISELRARGVRVVGARKGPDSVAHGMRWLETRHAIVIDPARCPVAAQEFCGYEYGMDGQGRFVARYPDRNNHTIDAVRYAMESVSARRVGVAAR